MSIVKKVELCEYKDLKFEVILDYYYDETLDEYYIDNVIGNSNLKKIRNEYRKIKGLLLDEEIKNIRNKYKLSQRDFSVALGFGEITITRYESKTVQDSSQDYIIRQSNLPSQFLKYLENNKEKYIKLNGITKYKELVNYVNNLSNNYDYIINQYDVKYRGNNEFNTLKFKAVIKEIKKLKQGLTKTYLAKSLYYVDNLSYKIFNKSMTGLVYISMPYGAYPKMYEQLLNDKDIMVKESWYGDYECYFISEVYSDYMLSDEEKKIIEFIMNAFSDFSSKDLVEYMHNELSYKETKLFDIISYNYANDIKIYDSFNLNKLTK